MSGKRRISPVFVTKDGRLITGLGVIVQVTGGLDPPVTIAATGTTKALTVSNASPGTGDVLSINSGTSARGLVITAPSTSGTAPSIFIDRTSATNSISLNASHSGGAACVLLTAVAPATGRGMVIDWTNATGASSQGIRVVGSTTGASTAITVESGLGGISINAGAGAGTGLAVAWGGASSGAAATFTGNSASNAVTVTAGTGRNAIQCASDSTVDALKSTAGNWELTGTNQKVIVGSTCWIATSSTQVSSTLANAVSNGVAITQMRGNITLTSTNTAAVSTSTFLVTNTLVAGANTSVFVDIKGYTGTMFTNGVPSLMVTGTTAGSYSIVVVNSHATNALSGTLTIGTMIVNN